MSAPRTPWKKVGRRPDLEVQLRRLCASQDEFVRRVGAAANVAEHGDLTYVAALKRTIRLLEQKLGPDGGPRMLG